MHRNQLIIDESVGANTTIVRAQSSGKSGAAECPVCGSGAARQSVMVQGPSRKLLRCRKCGLRYLFPMPTEEEMAHCFATRDKGSTQPAEARSAGLRHHVLSELSSYIHRILPAGGSILDVGCAVGYFLGSFFSSGWNRHGVELSAPRAERARSRGIDTYVGDTRSARYKSAAFDVITVLDTLYYFPDPCRELREFSRILKPGGWLLIEAPLAQTRLWRLKWCRGKFETTALGSPVPGDHLYFFTPESLSRALLQCGFSVYDVLPLPADDSGDGLRKFLYRAYSACSSAVWRASRRRIQLAPRFLIVARPGSNNRPDSTTHSAPVKAD